mmetsp:Transcript_65263/g.180317  ORF Transcript_65263/g.180317 Transcript_65263/m.180317 type:complete len:261 (+) Transcript_65263:355-1137(+)
MTVLMRGVAPRRWKHTACMYFLLPSVYAKPIKRIIRVPGVLDESHHRASMSTPADTRRRTAAAPELNIAARCSGLSPSGLFAVEARACNKCSTQAILEWTTAVCMGVMLHPENASKTARCWSNTRATAANPATAAVCSGVDLSKLVLMMLTSTRNRSNVAMAAGWPLSEAAWSGVWPRRTKYRGAGVLSENLKSAPDATQASMACVSPARHASIRGVVPWISSDHDVRRILERKSPSSVLAHPSMGCGKPSNIRARKAAK